MKVVAMIPVKLNNERIPGKNLKKFYDGTPLISFIQKSLQKAEEVNEIYVYCSSRDVCKYLEEGIHYLERPEFLDSDISNCNDIIREFMKVVEADIYVVSHVTGPFTKPSSIDSCVKAVKGGKYDSAFLAKRMQEFLWCEGQALNFDIQNFPRTQDLKPIYSEAPGAYVFTEKTFQKYNRRVGIKPYIHEISEIESRDIDYPEDFQIAESIYKCMLKGNTSWDFWSKS